MSAPAREAMTCPILRSTDSWRLRPSGDRNDSYEFMWSLRTLGRGRCVRRGWLWPALRHEITIQPHVRTDRRQAKKLKHDSAKHPREQLQRQNGKTDERHERDQAKCRGCQQRHSRCGDNEREDHAKNGTDAAPLVTNEGNHPTPGF